MTRKKVTILTLQEKTDCGEPITMVTAYDYPSAGRGPRLDTILVGDSLGMVVLLRVHRGVTMEEMLHHCKAVPRVRLPDRGYALPSYQADR